MGLAYDWIKIGHLFSVIAWMAGIFYLPRLFVYHADAEAGSVQSETFKVMERRLLKGIMRPAMYGTWGFGRWRGLKGGWFSGVSWLWLKGLLVLALTVYHYQLDAWRKAFEIDANRRNSRFFRMMNELPTIILLGILTLVVLKPF